MYEMAWQMTHETMATTRQNGNKLTLKNNQIDCKIITSEKRTKKKPAQECGEEEKKITGE